MTGLSGFDFFILVFFFNMKSYFSFELCLSVSVWDRRGAKKGARNYWKHSWKIHFQLRLSLEDQCWDLFFRIKVLYYLTTLQLTNISQLWMHNIKEFLFCLVNLWLFSVVVPLRGALVPLCSHRHSSLTCSLSSSSDLSGPEDIPCHKHPKHSLLI